MKRKTQTQTLKIYSAALCQTGKAYSTLNSTKMNILWTLQVTTELQQNNQTDQLPI